MNAWQITLGCITAVASIAVAAGIEDTAAALLAWRAGSSATDQRESQARREEWWRRFQWATELALSDDKPRADIGVLLVRDAVHSPLAGDDELRAAVSGLEHTVALAVDRQRSPPYTESRTREADDDE